MIVDTTSKLSYMLTKLKEHEGSIAFDTEASSTRPEDAELAGLSFAIEHPTGYESFYVPFGHTEGKNLSTDLLGTLEGILRAGVYCHGAKYDLRLMNKYNVKVNLAGDTMSMVRLLGEVDYGIGLEDTIERWFGDVRTRFKDIAEYKEGNRKLQLTANEIPIEVMAPYAEEDAIDVLRLKKEAEHRMSTLAKGFLPYETAAMVHAASMEDAGLPVSLEWLQQQKAYGLDFIEQLHYEAHLALREAAAEQGYQLEAELAQRFGNKAYKNFTLANLRSAPQLQFILFELLGLPVVAKSKKTGKPSASKLAIEKLSEQSSAVALIREYRSAQAAMNRVKELIKYARPRGSYHYVHASLNPAGTATGRWSSNSPNAQNYPRAPYSFETPSGLKWDLAIRDAIAAPKGFYIVTADYGQIELRIATGLSREPRWLEAYAANQDIHATTAAAVFNKNINSVSKEERYVGKTLNFAMLFGATDKRIASLLNISKKEAIRIVKGFWQGLPQVAEWAENIRQQAYRKGYVTTIYGRRRHLEGLEDGREWVRQAAEREAVNTTIQGSAADLLKIGLQQQASVARWFKAQTFLVVHDQFVWLVPESVDAAVLAEALDPVISPQIPGFPEVVADWGIGRRFGSLKSFDHFSEIPLDNRDIFL